MVAGGRWEPMLAKSTASLRDVPGAPGAVAYEPKWDGYRGILERTGGGCRITSRHGTDLTDAFPDIAAAGTRQLRPGTVLDGELVIWARGRIDFAALATRLRSRRNAAAAASAQPATFMVFDVLVADRTDLVDKTLASRRRVLEQLSGDWEPPLQLTPQTTDRDTAATWFDDFAAADAGVEGLVAKALTGRYRPGRRDWHKVRIRATHDTVLGAVTGTLARPDRLVIGALDAHGRLRIVGATLPLTRASQVEIAELLTPADEDAHPWAAQASPRLLGHLGAPSGTKTPLARVTPEVVVEVSADTAFEHGRWRHAVTFERVRHDLAPDQVSPLSAEG